MTVARHCSLSAPTARSTKQEKQAFEQERARLKAEIAKDKAERKARGGKLSTKLGVDGYKPAAAQGVYGGPSAAGGAGAGGAAPADAAGPSEEQQVGHKSLLLFLCLSRRWGLGVGGAPPIPPVFLLAQRPHENFGREEYRPAHVLGTLHSVRSVLRETRVRDTGKRYMCWLFIAVGVQPLKEPPALLSDTDVNHSPPTPQSKAAKDRHNRKSPYLGSCVVQMGVWRFVTPTHGAMALCAACPMLLCAFPSGDLKRQTLT